MAMTKIYKTIFKVRRGPSEEWERVNPILQEGEPGFATDTYVYKVGDGKTAWNDLVTPNASSNEYVVNRDTHYDFPSIGYSNVIYKAEKEKMLYQWDPVNLKYEALNSTTTDVTSVEIIYGGDANGTA